MATQRVDETRQQFNDRLRSYKRQWKRNRYNNDEVFRQKELEISNRCGRNWYQKKKHNKTYKYIIKIRNYTRNQIIPYMKIEKCEICSNTKNLDVHHKIYTFPVEKEHLMVLCKHCHQMWHQDNSYEVIPQDVIYISVCEECSSIYETIWTFQKFCSKKCRDKVRK